jgi:hypothetical protein
MRYEAGSTVPVLPNASGFPQDDGSTILLVPRQDRFRLDINNHGKTPAYLKYVTIGFCDASAPPLQPRYRDIQFPWRDAIRPGDQSRPIKTVDVPVDRYPSTAICGRYYWDDIWGTHWSSGFIYGIPHGQARENASISIELRIEISKRYWDDREGDLPPGDDDRES